MSTTRDGSFTIIECDTKGCNESEQISDWQEEWPTLKELGWRAVKTGREWTHVCPSCAKENNDLSSLTRGLK